MLWLQSVRLGSPLGTLLGNAVKQNRVDVGLGLLLKCNAGLRSVHLSRLQCKMRLIEQDTLESECGPRSSVENTLESVEHKILYNSVLEVRSWNRQRTRKVESQKRQRFQVKNVSKSVHDVDIPIALKYMPGYDMLKQDNTKIESDNYNSEVSNDTSVNLPYTINNTCFKVDPEKCEEQNATLSSSEVTSRNWMRDYDVYDEHETNAEDRPWQLDYGTTDVNIPVSKVPCGGCGAFLHCQNTAIPGYLPSELFSKRSNSELRSMTCQRCHFMTHYDTALAVNVSADDYPRMLSRIALEKALVILMVDLMDFPCSIWPHILDIIGLKRPVVVVGNKVDLIPQDSPGFLDNVERVLLRELERAGISAANIKHVALVSAKTGYGIDQLITKLHTAWEYKGDVYLVGCTNVGKSTLFNALLQSDYCKVKAVDLVQRATTSPWPGTTLNLLKFPILRPSGIRMYVRTQRLKSERERLNAERRLRQHQTGSRRESATLIGHVGRTFLSETALRETADPFEVNALGQTGRSNALGINPNDKQFVDSKWCYDTPGVIQPDQVINLLTTEELMFTLPRKLLHPRTFSIAPGNTLFIAGLARLDYVRGDKAIRWTVLASDSLPLTVCRTDDAQQVYSALIGSELLAVPRGGTERLQQWPALVAAKETIRMTGQDWRQSCADVVLSSAGWVSITPGPDMEVELQAWSPGGVGIFVRSPLLRYAVNHRGARIRRSPAYKRGLGLYKTIPV